LRQSEENNEQSEEDSAGRTLARARTLTVLSRLDSDHKAQVVQFVYEAGLIARGHRVLDLSGADLRRANLSRASLSGADLSGPKPELHEEADGPTGPDLRGADLSGADPSKASVYEEQLTQAKSFEGATMPDGQTLRGDETPDGPTFEDWLKDKKAREEAEEDE
jgi:hypothetical protein